MYDIQNHFVKSFINLVGAIRTTGSTVDATAGQLGFASAKTWQFIPTGSASVATHPEVYLIQGSLYQDDKLGQHPTGRASHGGYKESVKSRKINGRYITWFAKKNPVEEKPHVVQIGYNGSVGCACPEFEKDKYYWIRVELKGSPVLRAYTRNLYRTIGVYTGCPDGDCTDLGCAESADPKKVFEKFAELIKTDPEIAKFLKEVKVVTEGNSSLTGTEFGVYQASRCDDGTIKSIAEVAGAYGTDIKLLSHTGSTSTYEITSEEAPDDSVELELTWVLVDTVYKVTKQICLTLPLKADGSSNLADVTTYYDGILSNVAVYDEGTTTTSTTTTTTSTTTTSTTSTSTTTEAGTSYVGCTETLQADLLSDNFVDLICEGVDVGTFTFPTAYQGYSWEECPCEDEADNVDQCVGLRLVAKKISEITDSFGDCSFDQFDHIEYEPIKILVSFVDMDGEACAFKSMAVTEIQQPVIRQGLGETVVRDLIQSAMYEQQFFFEDNRLREVTAYPYLNAVERSAKYVTYYIAHNVPTGIGPSGNIGQDRFLYKIFVRQGTDSSTLEAWMNAYLTSAGTGVTLQTL